MEQATQAPLKKTPLNARHRASGAKMVPFGGWDMPVEYAGGGVVSEHMAVRTRAGIFDVSHMGEIEIAGKDALAAVQRISSDYAWIAEHIQRVGDAVAVDASSRYALIALQGPDAQRILQPLTGVDLAGIKYYWFAHGEVASVR